MRSSGPDSTDGGKPTDEPNPCVLYERSLLGTDGQELIAEPDLKEVERLLFEKFAEGELMIKLKDPGQEKEQNLIVSSIIVSRSEEDDIDKREEPFRELSPGFKIKVADTAKIITTKDESAPITLGDCYLSCKEEDSMTCQTFSFCDTGNIECVISSLLIDESSEVDPENGPLEMNRNCSTYTMSYMNRFDKFAGNVDEITGEILEKKTKDAATCAKECSSIDEFKCESFAFCGSECILRKEHMFEVTTIEPVEKENRRNVTGKGCTLYHCKFLQLLLTILSSILLLLLLVPCWCGPQSLHFPNDPPFISSHLVSDEKILRSAMKVLKLTTSFQTISLPIFLFEAVPTDTCHINVYYETSNCFSFLLFHHPYTSSYKIPILLYSLTVPLYLFTT